MTLRSVGRMSWFSRQRSLLDDTLIFFTSDNGPETLKRYRGACRSYGTTGGLRGMNLHTYEGGIRVPGILHWPANIQGGQVIDTPVSAVDLLPTLREIVGSSSDPDYRVDGASWLPLIHGDRWKRDKPLFWFSYRALTPPRFTIRDGRWKLLASWDGPLMREARGGPGGRNINPDAIRLFKSAELAEFELYDLSTGEHETDNVADDYPQHRERLRRQAKRLFAELKDEVPDWPATKAFWEKP